MFSGVCVFGPLDKKMKSFERPWFEVVAPAEHSVPFGELHEVVFTKHVYEWDFEAKCWQYVFPR